jgi:Ca2+-binding protein (EF-Hand superfamily)
MDADRDNNGQLDRAEVARLAATALGADLDDESLERVLAELDSDDDGLISFDEFRRWLESLQADQRPSDRPG